MLEVIYPHIETGVIPLTITKNISIADIPEVINLNNYGMFERNDTPPDHAPPPLNINDMLEGLRAGDTIKATYLGPKIIGFSWLKSEVDHIYVNVLSVHPDYRDKGLGTKYLVAADKEAINSDLLKCKLTVDPWNGRGVNAYLQHGYKIVDFKDSYFGESYPNSQRFVMEKNLSPTYHEFKKQVGIKASESSKMKFALSEGYLGTHLIRSYTGDNRDNIIVFQK